MKKLVFLLLIGMGLNAAAQDKTADSIDSYLKAKIKAQRIPGLQVAIIQHGAIILSKSYGLANIQDSVPVTHLTRFSINSISKAFTGTAIMQLAEAGKIELNAPVSSYLDSLPTAWQSVTLRQLLSHISGLPNIMGDDNGKIITEEEEEIAWTDIQKAPLQFAKGERFSYNQSNYVLLGKIINKFTSMDFTQYIKTRQLDVVGMPSTVYGDSKVVIPMESRGYTFFHAHNQTGPLNNVFEGFPPYLWTASGINSSAEDIAHWLIALQAGKLFTDKNSLNTLWTPGRLNNGTTSGFGPLLNGYAMGFETVIRDEHPAIAAVGGGRAAFFVYPKDDLAIIILTNLKGASPEAFIDDIASFYFPDMKPINGFGLSGDVKQLRAEVIKKGYNNAIPIATELKQKNLQLIFGEQDIFKWGLTLFTGGQKEQALEVFKLNASLYPDTYTFDTLGQVYEETGNKALAIQSYRKASELDAKNSHAAERLKKLQ